MLKYTTMFNNTILTKQTTFLQQQYDSLLCNEHNVRIIRYGGDICKDIHILLTKILWIQNKPNLFSLHDFCIYKSISLFSQKYDKKIIWRQRDIDEIYSISTE